MRKDLKKIRIKSGYSIRKAASAIGISFVAYMKIEKGSSLGSIETWKNIQKVFKIKDDLMWRIIVPCMKDR